jgi:CBS-domain-containing membrane protein
MHLSAAWALFLDRDLQSMTVVDDSGRPVGTLMRRDLADAVLDGAPTVPTAKLEDLTPLDEASMRNQSADWRPGGHHEEAMVEDIMRGSVNTLPAWASLKDAAAVLEAAQLSEVVVVDEQGRMLGLVASEELVPYLPPAPDAGRARPRPRPAPRSPARR